jgi:thioredoxin reductase (NADPH)
MQKEKVIIIGSGPAGLTAALYIARSNLKPLVISGNQLGGQISITNEVENYPGFPEGISGPELVELMQKQAERFGARILVDEVTEVDFSKGSPFRIKTHGDGFDSEAVIIAVGASPNRLGIPGEEEFIGRGVSFCATCDGFFFRDKDVLVVGGGDSAIEEALFLTRFVNRVRVIHRRDELRAGEALKRRAFENEKIEFVWNSVLEEIRGDGKVESALARNVKKDETVSLDTDGVFIFSVPGVFAAGEIQDSVFRQITTSVGQGAAAGMMTERWLEEQE